MKITLRFLSCLVCLLPAVGLGQGRILFTNPTAPTRVGAINGPLAGSEYWAELLVGLTVDSLSPIPPASPHLINGVVTYGEVTTPYFFGEQVYVQMAAWNGDLWGADFEQVPANQLGFTDVVSVMVRPSTQSPDFPPFTRSAIVPAVPEPAAWSLVILGALWTWRRSTRMKRN